MKQRCFLWSVSQGNEKKIGMIADFFHTFHYLPPNDCHKG